MYDPFFALKIGGEVLLKSFPFYNSIIIKIKISTYEKFTIIKLKSVKRKL